MRTLITKHSLLRPLFAALVLVLAAGCGSGNFSGNSSSSFVGQEIPVQCANPGSGLAAVDLSGQCRAAPQATMGALEAVSG